MIIIQMCTYYQQTVKIRLFDDKIEYSSKAGAKWDYTSKHFRSSLFWYGSCWFVFLLVCVRLYLFVFSSLFRILLCYRIIWILLWCHPPSLWISFSTYRFWLLFGILKIIKIWKIKYVADIRSYKKERCCMIDNETKY